MKKHLISLFIAGLLLLPTTKVIAQEQPPEIAKLNPQLTACLQQKMGTTVFAEIKSGTRQPSETEKQAGEECFAKFGQDMMKGQPDAQKRNLDFSPETDKCLQSKLGASYKDKLRNAKSKTEGDAIMSQTKECFGGHGGRGDEKQLPDNVRACIENTVGKAGAEKIFKGEKPAPESAEMKKMESAGCFAGFNRGQGKVNDIPPDKRQCIEKIIGSIQGEPTEAQKEEIGTKCFNGKKPGDPGKPGDDEGRRLPKEIESCLQSAIGENFKTKPPDQFSQDERDKANSCFSKHNFAPQGNKPGEQHPPNMSEETLKCVERVSGKSIQSREFDDETKGKIDKECFKGRGGPEGQNRPERERAPNPKLTPESKSCEDKVVSGIKEQLPPDEVEKQVNEQCYKGEHFGEPQKTDDRSQSPVGGQFTPGNTGDGGQQMPGDYQQRQRLEGEIGDDNGKYCQENPSACQSPKPEM